MMEDVEERIRKRAYEIWEREGCPNGREAEHWRQAAEEIAAQPTTGFAVSDEAGPAPDATVAGATIAGATKPTTRRRTAGGTKEPTAQPAAAGAAAKPAARTAAKAATANTSMGSTSTTGEPAAKPKGTRGRKKTE